MKHGCLITFEGVDGCGKSTQLALAADWLRGQGLAVLATHEPGATPLGQRLRELLLGHRHRPVAEAELLMFLADRAQHVRETIQPAMAKGRIVLCDRYSDSTYAYQMAARSLGEGPEIHRLLGFAECGVQPTLTLWFDVPVERAWERMQKRRGQGGEHSRFDEETRTFHQRVADAFARRHRHEPERIRRIDAAGDIQQVHRQVRQCLAAHLGGRG